MKRPPIVIKSYGSLPRNENYPLQEFRLRVVKYHNSTRLFDIREYVTCKEFEGYSPKGISVNREQLLYLAAQLHDIINCMVEEPLMQTKLLLAQPNITSAEEGTINPRG